MGALSEVLSSVLLFFLVFGMSATVDIEKLRKQLENKHALLTGVSLQFLILPFVGFVVVKVCDYSAPIGITLLVVTTSPGGSYSNWWCSLFNAELALSVTMTALSTFLSVIMLPVNLIIYASSSYSSSVVKSLDWRALFMSLFVVIGGISSGLFCSAYFKDSPRKSKQIHKAANRFGNVAGLCLITFSVAVSSSDHKAALWDEDLKFFIGVAIPAVIGIIIATLMATTFNLEKPERVAVAVESCYQNTGIATSVAVFMFNSDEDALATAISVPLYYGMVEAVLLAVYCVVCWKIGWTKAPPDENICVVIATSYEVEQQEEGEDVAAVGVALENVSEVENVEEGVEGDASKSPEDLVFEQTIDGMPVAEDAVQDIGEGSVVLRKKDSHGNNSSIRSNTNLNDPSQSQSSDHDVLRHPEETEGTASVADESLSDDVVEAADQTEDHIEIGRFGRAVSQIKARVTGYRQAPLPQEDGSIQKSPPRMPASMAESGDNDDDSPHQKIDGSSSRRLNRSYGQLPNAPDSPKRGQSTNDGDSTIQEEEAATPAEGKTID